ncbi:hypothetical protein HDU85_004381 [Gaertneriomyces sp. JEL0708]|nr:hypothetical protein HDU85_004381 [Gaertneriomyces sp. JEL0708]
MTRRPSVAPPLSPQGTYTALPDILRDSPSPALILPARNKYPTYKVYYSSLRAGIQNLRQQQPLCSLRPGDVLTFLLPNSLEFVATFFATTANRAIANPLNPNYKAEEIAFYLDDCKPKAIIVPAGEQGKAILAAVKRAIEITKMDIPVWAIRAEITGHLVEGRYKGGVEGKAVLNLVAGKASEKVVTEKARGAPSSDDVALMLHTSGTTGRPKGVPLTHANILRTLRNIEETYRLSATDRTYVVMPLFHVHGLIGSLLSTLRSGGTAIIPPKFSVTQFWQDFLQHEATWYSAVPTIHQMLLLKADETYPGHSGKIRFIRSCSASLAPATLLQLEKAFKAPVVEAYAMSEAAHQMTSNFLPPGMRKPGSVGKGRGVDVAILDDKGQKVKCKGVGEVCVRGANVIKGYHNNPKATAESFFRDPDGGAPWFRTGDLGYVDEIGFVFLVGRIKEQINRGGEKISPIEIDQVLLQHPGVSEAVVYPVPSTVYGQEIEAAVVAKDAAKGKLTEAELIRFCKERLAAFKVPRKIHVVDVVPKTATGKVQRRLVAEVLGPKQAKL